MSVRGCVPLILAIGVLIASGAIRDLWAGRARDPEALRAAGERVSAVPAIMGEWTSVETPLPPDALAMGGIAHAVSRRYSHAATGRSVTLTLLCGPSGPLALHPPTACYLGSGYTLHAEPRRQTVQRENDGNDAGHEFLDAVFAPPNPQAAGRVRIFWGWSVDGRWSAPDSPRLRFAGEPVLYKLYVTEEIAGDSSAENSDLQTFLRDALPHIERALNPEAAQGGGA